MNFWCLEYVVFRFGFRMRNAYVLYSSTFLSFKCQDLQSDFEADSGEGKFQEKIFRNENLTFSDYGK